MPLEIYFEKVMFKAVFYIRFCKHAINRNHLFNESKNRGNYYFNWLFIII